MGGHGSGQRPRFDHAKVIELATGHPEYNNVDIGQLVGGISRERVRQILAAEGIFVGHKAKCFFCRASIPRGASKFVEVELSYGRAKTKRVRRCADCDSSRRIKKKEERWVSLLCDQCGQSVTKSASEVRVGKLRGDFHDWCSEQCRGIWFDALPRKTAARART